MKLFNSDQIRSIEQESIEEGCYSSRELMDRAANAFVSWLRPQIMMQDRIVIVCGNGNNGADGLVVGEKMHQYGYIVRLIVLRFNDKGSPDFLFHLNRLQRRNTIQITIVTDTDDLPVMDEGVIVDAIFGSGLSRQVRSPYAEILESINQSGAKIYAIDIPSGLPGEGIPLGLAVKAHATCSFEFPRQIFFTKEGLGYTGKWDYRSIGLVQTYISRVETSFNLIDHSMVQSILPVRPSYSHKGNYGHVHLVVSKQGMAGAGILASRAALRAGVGLCSVTTADSNRIIFQSANPEVMVKSDFENERFTDSDLTTVAIGPGLGREASSIAMFRKLLERYSKPLVIDADGLNILSENRELLELLPPCSILTPHPKEFERLSGSYKDSLERLKLQKNFSKKYKVIIVLKDHHTVISSPDGRVYFNSTGNAGMATGGAGDILTGVIAGLLAQIGDPLQAAIAGTYVHGLSGDLYTEEAAKISLIASDLIDYLPQAFMAIAKFKK